MCVLLITRLLWLVGRLSARNRFYIHDFVFLFVNYSCYICYLYLD